MTEQQYIDATDLAKLRIASNIIRDVLPNLSSVVDKPRHVMVCRAIQDWLDCLFEKMDLEEETGMDNGGQKPPSGA